MFKHESISTTPNKNAECAAGWIAHYVIGAIFALTFVTLTSPQWLHQPSLFPALFFGIATVVMPYCIMQPCFGLGFAASKTPKPIQARLRSLTAHTIFGFGLYFSAMLQGIFRD